MPPNDTIMKEMCTLYQYEFYSASWEGANCNLIQPLKKSFKEAKKLDGTFAVEGWMTPNI